MSKPDLASSTEHSAINAIAAAQYPSVPLVAECSHGQLPQAALDSFARSPRFSLVDTTPATGAAASLTPVTLPFPIGALIGSETQLAQLNHWAVQWLLPGELVCPGHAGTAAALVAGDLPRLAAPHEGRVSNRARAPWLTQGHGRGMSGEDSAYRRDSRIEIVLHCSGPMCS